MKLFNKRTLFILVILIGKNISAQTIPTLTPTIGKMMDFTPERKAEWVIRDKAMQDLTDGKRTWEELTPEEEELFTKYGEVYESMWDIVGSACSWYCGGGLDTQTASSSLRPQGSNTYSPENAHDLSYETAWVEGADDYGIGEYIEYHLRPENPRITEIIVVNGYVKSDAAWKNNSRVKKLKVYLNDRPLAYLALEDSKAEQHFAVEAIGYADRSDMDALKSKPASVLKFEIVEVYPGLKWKDTAITEIYFDGIDVH